LSTLACFDSDLFHLTKWPHCGTVGLKAQQIAVNMRRTAFDFAIPPNPRQNLHFCDLLAVKYVVFGCNGASSSLFKIFSQLTWRQGKFLELLNIGFSTSVPYGM
jgi:hypothetical protein